MSTYRNKFIWIQTTMLVVAYFHYGTGRSDIQSFEKDDDAKNWLYEEWGFLLDTATQSAYREEASLGECCYMLRGKGVVVEYLR